MISTSCPGFLDQHGIWNNGFDCSSPQICCGPDTDRYCCQPSASSSSPATPLDREINELDFHGSNSFLTDQWLFLHLCLLGILLAITLLIAVMIYQCLASIRRQRQRQHKSSSTAQIPLPAASPLLIEHNRAVSNRISTISSAPSEAKSRCTDASMVSNTPLNLYPTTYSRGSTSTTSSSYYMFPNEFEQLCK